MDAELAAWLKPVNAFIEYETETISEINSIEAKFGTWKPWLADHFDQLRTAASLNAAVCRKIAQCAPKMIDPASFELLGAPEAQSTQLDAEKVCSTLRQLAREWSAEGQAEREVSFSRIVAAFKANLDTGKKIVVPGCGLGRLPFELSKVGFHAIGNEFSTHMIYASDLILNSTSAANCLEIFPYIHNRSHIRSRSDQLAKVQVPDVWPGDLAGDLEMAIGDFSESFANAEKVDGVATAFFLDTSDDIFATLGTISNLVVPGGLWVNFGPLLWHFENDPERGGIELCLDDLLEVIQRHGWEILELETDIKTTYCTSPKALGSFVYKCVFFVARKKATHVGIRN